MAKKKRHTTDDKIDESLSLLSNNPTFLKIIKEEQKIPDLMNSSFYSTAGVNKLPTIKVSRSKLTFYDK